MVDSLESSGMVFVGHGDDGKRMEIMELQGTCIKHFINVSSR